MPLARSGRNDIDRTISAIGIAACSRSVRIWVRPADPDPDSWVCHYRAARNPNPRSTSSAFSPSVPRAGSTPSWVAARTGRRRRAPAAAARHAARSRQTQCTTTNRFVAGSPSSASLCVASSLLGAATKRPLVSRSPVRSTRASGKAAHSRAAWRRELVRPLERLVGQRILVVESAVPAIRRTPAGSLPDQAASQPSISSSTSAPDHVRPLPALEHGMPSPGVDASA